MHIFSRYNNEIIELNEVTFSIKEYKELILLKNFINQCIDDIKKDTEFEHKHLNDYLDENKISYDEKNDIIIYKIQK